MASHLESCLVRIHSDDGIVGAGFLVNDEHVVTCAHVVAGALNCPVDEILKKKVKLDFPLLEGGPGISAVVQFCSCVEGYGETDIAGLKLYKDKALLNGAAPTRLVKLRGYRGRVVDLFGCPRDHPKGDWILDAVLSNPVHSSRVQLEIRGNLANPVRPGFSGGPVWDKNEQAIVGMIVEANEKYGTGEMIPVTVLAETWDVVRKVATVPVGRLSNVPPLPSRFVPRPEYMEPLKAKLLGESDKAVAVTAMGSKKVGVQGMGGIGKTVLAAAAVRDEDVRRAYPDGAIWLTLGQQPNLVARQIQLAKVLGDQQPAFGDAQEGKARLEELLVDKTCLVVLDDVWKDEHAEAFDVLGGHCRMLITTRFRNIVRSLQADEQELGILDEPQALVLLSKWARITVENLPNQAHEIVKECGRLPLALATIGAMIQHRPERWDNALQRLRDADLEKFKREFPGYPYPNLFRAMAVSVDALDDQDKERYLDFAVFPEDTPIPEETLQTLWQADDLSPYDVQELLDLLEDRSLLRRDEPGRLTLHDLQLDYVRKEVSDGLTARHKKLLDAYRQRCPDGWHSGPNDGYFFEYLAHHLCQTGLEEELREVLFDYRWLEKKLQVTNPNALVTDYDFLPDDADLQLVQGAMRLSSNALAEDVRHLPGQLHGRLLEDKAEPIGSLLDQASNCQSGPWLRPMTVSLTPPGGPLVRTLTAHSGSVNAVEVTPDGRYAVAGYAARILMVWDLTTGEKLHELKGHANSVWAVAVTRDGRYAVSGSDDQSLMVWDLATGKKLRQLKGHARTVRAVTVTADGRYAVSGSLDQTLIVWDLETGKNLRQLKGHTASVWAVAVTPDGRYAVSASHDKTLKVWDLATGKNLRELAGHVAPVNAVAVTTDGHYAVSGSDDKTLKVWDLQSGQEVCSLEGHAGEVSALAVTHDGRYVVSGSFDNTLKVWNLQTGKEVRQMAGHANVVRAVAVTRDGRYAASGSYDSTLKVWDLKTGKELSEVAGHADCVKALALTHDGRYAVSASHDKTLKVWDLTTGKNLLELADHVGPVNAVAVTSDDRYAVSGSDDRTLKVWDLTTGKKVRDLEGHRHNVYAVAVTGDGRYVVSGSEDRTLMIWDLTTGKKLREMRGHAAFVNAVAVTRDGRYAVSGSHDHTLKVWDLNSDKVIADFHGQSDIRCCAVAPDSVSIVAGEESGRLHFLRLENVR